MEYCHFVNVDPETKQERMHHITTDFPYGADLCDLHIFPGNMFPWHWHRELEVFYMRRGSLTYHLPCGAVTFSQGEGGFINSNILHKTTCAPEDACIQEEQQFLPEFVGVNSLLLRKYVQPIVSSSELPFVKLDPSTAAHRPLLELLCGCYRLYEEKPEGYELELQQRLLQFWKLLFALTQPLHKSGHTSADDQRIKQMLTFIAAHYAEPLHLSQIAASAYISPRACGRCFQTQLGTTPTAYLTDYRTQQAGQLLADTSLSVGEIALQCGFCSSSHFSRVFREKTGLSPKLYRAQCRKKRCPDRL